MTLECIVILGNKSEPLYSYAPPGEEALDVPEESDIFGFKAQDANPTGLTMRQEFMMHSALDRLEEFLGSPRYFDLVKMQRGSKWLGSLLPMENCEIYGYVTPSCTKILALVKRDSVIPLEKRREVDLRALFTNVHDCYVKYTMNPFTKIRGKIEPPCASFEEGIRRAVDNYGASLAEQAAAKKAAAEAKEE